MMGIAFARLMNGWLRYRLKDKPLNAQAIANLAALQHIRAERLARDFRYVAVDLETTGMCLKDDCVLSIGAVRIADGRIRLGDIFNELVNPGRDIPDSSIKIHGIVPDMVRSAPPAGEVFQRFLAYLGTDILVGHNIAFDLYFINKAMFNINGFPIQNLTLDTMPLSRAFGLTVHGYPYSVVWDSSQNELCSLAHCAGFELVERHTALGDALATAMVFQRILARLESNGNGRLGALVRAGSWS
jgi:DNA polymerase III subunit epsilon